MFSDLHTYRAPSARPRRNLVDRPDHGKPGNALGRRQVLRGLAAAGAMAGGGSLLSACSSTSSSGQAATSPTSTAGHRGGALKVGLTGGSGSDTLDPHKGLTYLDPGPPPSPAPAPPPL